LGILTPDPVTKELTLTSVHPGVTVDRVVAATAWKLKVAPEVSTTPKPTESELTVLRDLMGQTGSLRADGSPLWGPQQDWQSRSPLIR
jgi:glutaconate CoA-transferase subunit B